jgi:hypothetical protein
MSEIEAERSGGFGNYANCKLFASRVDSMREDIDEQLETQVFAAGEASTSLYEGLQTLVDDGTHATTWGGKTRATETALKSTVTAQAGGSLAETDIQGICNTAWSKGAEPGTLIGFCDVDVFSLLQGIYAGRISYDRLQNTPDLHGGWTKVMYLNQTPIVMSTKCTASTLFLVDPRHAWIGINPNINFKSWDDPQPADDTMYMRLSVDAAMCGDKGKVHGRLYNIS